jgi:diguanylate cyclase (GGDEF)-like protein
MRISIKYKFVFFSAFLLFSLTIAISVFSITIDRNYIISNTREHISSVLRYFYETVINDTKENILEQGVMFSYNRKAVELIEKNDIKDLNDIFESYFNTGQFDLLFIYRDKKLIVSNKKDYGEYKMFLDGIMSWYDVDKNIVFVDGNEGLGLFVFSILPIKNDKDRTIGNIVIGTDLSNPKYTDNIYKTYHIDSSIFFKNKRINTTLSYEGRKQIGSLVDPEVAETVLGKNMTYSGQTYVTGIAYIASYLPIEGRDGKPIGILAVGTSMLSVEKVINKIILFILLFSFFMLILVITLAYLWSSFRMTKPIILVSQALKNISKRNLVIPKLVTDAKRNDEITDLYVAVNDMIKEMKEYEGKLEYAAFYDNMTKLPNKMLLFKIYSCPDYVLKNQKHCEGSDDQCECFQAEGKLGVMLYINVDDLKTVNSIFGHFIGDSLIKKIASRLKKIADRYDYFASRYGGDEFIICNNNIGKRGDILNLADEIIQEMKEPFDISGNIINTSVSIGISLCPENGKNLNQLIKNSDVAMRKAKEKGKNVYGFFNDKMMNELTNRIKMENELKQSVKDENFTVHFQPKYSMNENNITGFEALARWKNGDGEFVSPEIFIPMAERTGCIIRLGEWILRKSFEFIRNLNSKNAKNYSVSINISVAQIMQENFISLVETFMREYMISPEFVEFEITESVLIESYELVKIKIEHLRMMGIGIALDDFGKGYSSLGYLKTLPITTLKIDKIFIDDILDPGRNGNLAEDIIRIGHRMNLKIIAEGIETKEQFEMLKKYGCDIIQGYYISKALPENDLIGLLNNFNNLI